jgi:hypothetical protein
MKTFGINALAELLEKDRQTIVRALRGTPADDTERQQPRWRMATAVAALERHTRGNGFFSSGSREQEPALASLFAHFDRAYDLMKAMPNLDDRRRASMSLAPLIAETDAMLRAHGRAIGVGGELSDLRADKIRLLCMRGFETTCDWSFDEVHTHLNA